MTDLAGHGDGGGPRATLVTVTPAARDKALALRSAEPDGDRLALRLEVTGASGGAWTHALTFQWLTDAAPGDVVEWHDGLALVVPAGSVEPLRGASLDYVERGLGGGAFALENPNRPTPAAAAPPAEALSGPVAVRVHAVLEQYINPAIAAHGGHAELVAVEADVAYVRLGGGCQGCGMAPVTLGQGIEVAIRQAVPEVTRVVDVTDHSEGTNPYFEPAKK